MEKVKKILTTGGVIIAIAVMMLFISMKIKEKISNQLKGGSVTGQITPSEFTEPVYTYDFSKKKAPVKLEMKYYKDQWVGVTLPVGVNFRKDSDSDILTFYPMDKRTVISGPGKQASLPGGLARTVSRVKGIEKSGTLTIWLEKKKRG